MKERIIFRNRIFSIRISKPWLFAVRLSRYEDTTFHLAFCYVNLFINLGDFLEFMFDPYNVTSDLGFYVTHEAIFFSVFKCFSDHYFFPWSLVHHKTEVLVEDSGFLAGKSFWIQIPNGMSLYDHIPTKKTYPYRYTLKSGEVQERTATISVRKMEWRRKWLTWTSLFNVVVKEIDVLFDDEVGERSGTWKGGCIGCGYEMLPNETAIMTLRRMERERKF